MKSFIAAAILGAATAHVSDYEFMKWVAENGKQYGTVQEFEFRKATWMRAHAQIEYHNAN